MKRKKRLVSLLLAVVMCIGAVPYTASTVHAAGISEGQTELTVNQSVVAFGGYEWWVIGNANGGVYPQADSVTLLAKTLQDEWKNVKFSDSGSNYYVGSTLQQKMESIANDFSSAEKGLINSRNITDGIAGWGAYNQKVWSLSSDEWTAINNSTVRSYGANWWLRSPGYSNLAAYIDSAYGVVSIGVGSSRAVRPAFNLNLNSVLFTSLAAEGGKSSATVGSNLVGAEAPTGTVKFTMKDDSQMLTVKATTAQSTQTGETLSFSYSGATTGNNQYISCVLTDETGAVKYYGKLADSSNAASGTFSIPLADVADGSYTLQIFSEQANGDLYTDFCSEPVTMTLVVSSGSGTVSNFSGTIHDHAWSTEWSSDDTAHWHECLNEGCTVTDNSGKDGYKEHVYDQTDTDQSHLANAATCTEAATYYKSCVCGKNGTETFTDGEARGHAWGVWQSNGNNTHSRTCTRTGCMETQTEACTGGTATCQSKAVCTECQTEYGEKNLSNHTGTEAWVQTETTHQKVYSCCNTPISEAANHEWENGTCKVCMYPCTHTGGEATCTQKAICEICNSQYGVINPDNHKPSSEWTWENGKHYHICENGCGTHLEKADCSGGEATCIKKASCEVCGHEYGELAAHKLTYHEAKATTCDKEGYEAYWACEVCSKLFSDESGTTEISQPVSIPTTEHTPGTPATCTNDQTCTVCGTVLVEKLGHDYSAVVTEPICTANGYTTYTCSRCGDSYTDTETAALGHKAEKTEAKEPTETEAGNIAYWYCERCGKYFKDEALTQEITKEQTVLAAIGKPTEPIKPTEPPKDKPETDSPQTGDSSSLALWFTLMGVGAAGLGGALLLQKRRGSKAE